MGSGLVTEKSSANAERRGLVGAGSGPARGGAGSRAVKSGFDGKWAALRAEKSGLVPEGGGFQAQRSALVGVETGFDAQKTGFDVVKR